MLEIIACPQIGDDAVPTRNVVLTAHQQTVVETLVRSGRYQNASEVLREGLRMVEQREAEDAAKLAALQSAVQIGWRDLDAGHYRDVAEAELAQYVTGLARVISRPGVNLDFDDMDNRHRPRHMLRLPYVHPSTRQAFQERPQPGGSDSA